MDLKYSLVERGIAKVEQKSMAISDKRRAKDEMLIIGLLEKV